MLGASMVSTGMPPKWNGTSTVSSGSARRGSVRYPRLSMDCAVRACRVPALGSSCVSVRVSTTVVRTPCNPSSVASSMPTGPPPTTSTVVRSVSVTSTSVTPCSKYFDIGQYDFVFYTPGMERDFIDEVMDQWREQRPDLDPSPIGVLTRMTRIARRATLHLDESLRELGLQHADFSVLAALRRAGPPYELTLHDVGTWMLASNSTMTSRIDRLVAARLISRRQNPENRRTALLKLTAKGLRLIDRAIAIDLDNERQLIEGLSKTDQRALADLLRRLCRSMGEVAG
jgi:DNA-binding MarR family transcriptional regulator